MKIRKVLFATVAGLVITAAGFTGYKVYDDYRMSKRLSPLMLENLQILSQDENNTTTYSDYKNVGEYKITRNVNGKVKVETASSWSGDGEVDGTVVLVTYHNDCKSDKKTVHVTNRCELFLQSYFTRNDCA